jgi:hypothetical protein
MLSNLQQQCDMAVHTCGGLVDSERSINISIKRSKGVCSYYAPWKYRSPGMEFTGVIFRMTRDRENFDCCNCDLGVICLLFGLSRCDERSAIGVPTGKFSDGKKKEQEKYFVAQLDFVEIKSLSLTHVKTSYEGEDDKNLYSHSIYDL